MEASEVSTRLHSEVFELMADPTLRRHLLLCPSLNDEPNSFRFFIRHFVGGSRDPISEEVIIELTDKYPYEPPKIIITPQSPMKIEVPEIITNCPLAWSGIWNQGIRLKDLIVDIVQNLDAYWQNLYSYGQDIKLMDGKNLKIAKKSNDYQKNFQTEENPPKIHPYEKGLLLRLQEIVKSIKWKDMEIVRFLATADQKSLERMDPKRLLQWLIGLNQFRNEMKRQLYNGQWVHKILKSQASLVVKKHLIGNSPWLAQEIVKWEQNSQQTHNPCDLG